MSHILLSRLLTAIKKTCINALWMEPATIIVKWNGTTAKREDQRDSLTLAVGMKKQAAGHAHGNLIRARLRALALRMMSLARSSCRQSNRRLRNLHTAWRLHPKPRWKTT